MNNYPPVQGNQKKIRLVNLLNNLAILAWGLLLLKYAITGQYRVLIHPNYFYLMLATSILLLILSVFKTKQLLQFASSPSEQHLNIFPPGVGSSLLLTAAVAGLLIPPTVLASQTALQRGVSEALPATSHQPQAFTSQTKPEERSLIDWIRTMNAYPEPEAYAGQPADITGFVIKLPELPDNYLLLSRFILTCCAVDAYPVYIPVELPANVQSYPSDSWLNVKGTMTAQTLKIRDRTDIPQEQRRLVLQAETITAIPIPKDPYSYR